MSSTFKSPEYNLVEAVFSKILFISWPREYFNKIDDPNGCKIFYNSVYENTKKMLDETLSVCHPGGWILEGYIQLELWTAIYYYDNPKKNFGFNGPIEAAPIGRYGWRYIIEASLENLSQRRTYDRLRPEKKDVETVFTLLCILSNSSEISNLIHFLPNYFKNPNIDFGVKALMDFPFLFEKDKDDFLSIMKDVHEPIDWQKYPEFKPIIGDNEITRQLNTILNTHFGFTIFDIKKIIQKIEDIGIEWNAGILVLPYNYAIALLASDELAKFQKVKKIIDLFLLDTVNIPHKKRNFLQKSQLNRLLNFGGIYISNLDLIESIYDNQSSTIDFIQQSKEHVLLSSTILAEWIDILMIRILFGQRNDLKEKNQSLKKDLSLLESYYHKNVFEHGISDILRKNSYFCANIDKIGKRKIPCGEIDTVAFNAEKSVLLIIEAKNHAPAIDAKALGQILSDHFEQKKYHDKFLKKIEWVRSNLSTISDIFTHKGSSSIPDNVIIKSFFVTGNSSIIKYFVTEYEVFPFYKIEDYL